MPRRTGAEAEEAAKKAKNVRWRYAIRHPDFRAELGVLGYLLGNEREEFSKRFDELLKKWGFQYIGGEILSSLPHLDGLPQDEISFLEAYSDIVLSYPVLDIETDEDHILLLKIDLNNPLDLLQALVENELRSAMEWHQERPSGRRRLDKADFYLEVYDRAVRGETFKAIARALEQKPSTVKGALIAAMRNIFGSAEAPTKKALPLADFDKDEHVERCKTCKAAQRFEDMCGQTRAYALKGHVGQREVTGYDTTR